VQVQLGEAIAWRNLFWSLSNAMCANPDPWVGDAVLPELKAALAYRVFAPEAYPRILDIVRRTATSSLIYLPSGVRDFQNPELRPLLDQYVRGSFGVDAMERVKTMKLLWDCVGTEFGGRHELYEMNYAGGWEDTRLQTLTGAQRGPELKAMQALVEQCMADYDETGWTGGTWLNPDDATP
jgi:4-hydroxyphenylacetate 3-monooxygenase